MEELVQFLILSIIAYLCAYPLIILQELGKSTLEHPIRATTDKILLLDIVNFKNNKLLA
jgi:hypothetical protein